MPVYSSHLVTYQGLRVGDRIREERQSRGLTLKDLASGSDISSARLSEIENSHHVLDLRQVLRIAEAMGLPSGHFLPADATRPYHITREAEVRARPPHRMLFNGEGSEAEGEGRLQLWPLADLFVGRHIEPAFGRIMPRPDDGLRWSHQHEEAFVFVLRGRLEFSIQTPAGIAREEMGAGDSVYYRSDLLHSLRSLEDEPAEAIHVFCSPSGLTSTGFGVTISDVQQERPLDIAQQTGRKLKLLREMHGWPERHVADLMSVPERQLRQIERGDRPIPLDLMLELARLYGKPLRELIGQPTGNGPHYFVQRADETAALPSRKRRTPVERPEAPSSKTCHAFSGGYTHRSMYPYLLRLLNVDLETLTMHEHHGQEFLYVLDGELELTTFIGDEQVKDTLRPGDSIFIDSSVPHLLRGQTRSPFSKTMAEVIDVFWCPLGEGYLFGE
jgi:transcriptional regulator with XRE-family HTH domain